MPDPSSTSVCTAYQVTDQFGRVHARAAVAGRPALYVVATRHGAGLLAEWTRGLRALATASDTAGATRLAREVADRDAAAAMPVAVIPVVAIPGVPPFLRGAVRRLLPRDPEAWVLVDFDGALAGLAASEASCTVTLVDASGGVRTRTVVAHYQPEVAGALLAAATGAR